MKILCGWCGKKLGDKEPLQNTSVNFVRCPDCLQKFLVGYTPEKFKQMTSEWREHLAKIRSGASDEEKNKATFQFSQFLITNYDFLNDEGRDLADKLSNGLLDEVERAMAGAPDSKETRQLKRHIKGARGERLDAAAYIKSLRELPEDPPKFHIVARELFEKNMQHIMDLWTDVVQKNTLSGSQQFCAASLAGLCIEELLVASHLIQHAFGNQGMAHIRATHEALDLMDLFKRYPEYVEIFIGDDRKELKKLRPVKVREKLKKDMVHVKFYEHFSEIGTHPTFKALQERVKRLVKESESGNPAFAFTIGGTLRSRMQWLMTLPVLFLTMLDLAAKIADNFPQFLNQDDCRYRIQEMVDDVQKYEEEYIFKPISEGGGDITKIRDGSRKAFEKMKSAFREPLAS